MFFPAFTNQSPFHDDVLLCTHTLVPFQRRCSFLHFHTGPLSTTMFFSASSHQSYLSTALCFLAFSNKSSSLHCHTSPISPQQCSSLHSQISYLPCVFTLVPSFYDNDVLPSILTPVPPFHNVLLCIPTPGQHVHNSSLHLHGDVLPCIYPQQCCSRHIMTLFHVYFNSNRYLHSSRMTVCSLHISTKMLFPVCRAGGRGGRRGGRGRGRRGSGGVRQYLQHRLLWARYTGRSQEALDRVLLTIINSKCR